MVIRQPWEMSVQTVVQTRRPAFGDRGIQISCNSSFGGKISLVFILTDLIIFEPTNSKSLFIQSFRQSRTNITLREHVVTLPRWDKAFNKGDNR